MSYKTIMVQLDPFDISNNLVGLTVDLCEKFQANLIGFATCNVRTVITAPDGLAIAGELFEQERKNIEERLIAAEADFRRMTASLGTVDWRGYMGIPTRVLGEQVRSADLVVTRSPAAGTTDYDRTISLGEFVLAAGRPVLVAGEGAKAPGSRVLVAWKNVREARRAVADALPFLHRAQEIRIVTVEDKDRLAAKAEVDAVVDFLGAHGITTAKGEVVPADDDNGGPLLTKAKEMGADLVVSGAYGHSRIREWIFGGVTQSLLDDTSICKLMSY